MKVTLKDFLKEQAKLGVDVPHIFEDMSIGPEGQINDDSQPQDFQDWDNTDIAGMRMESLLTQMMDEVIDDIKREVTLKFGKPNPAVEKQMAKMIADLWIDSINRDFVELRKFNNATNLDEGFFGDLKNKLSGAVEYNTANNYAGSPEAQAFVTKDRRSKVQIDTLIKKGMTPEEAKSAVMFVFDKSDKNPLGFVGKSTVYDPQTKTLKVTSAGGMNPSLGSL